MALDGLRAPVVTAAFPGPSVYAKTARGQLARYCAVNCVSSAAQLREFRGSGGEWSFVPAESTDTLLTFKRGTSAPRGKAAAAAPKAAAKTKAAAAPKAAAPKAAAGGAGAGRGAKTRGTKRRATAADED